MTGIDFLRGVAKLMSGNSQYTCSSDTCLRAVMCHLLIISLSNNIWTPAAALLKNEQAFPQGEAAFERNGVIFANAWKQSIPFLIPNKTYVYDSLVFPRANAATDAFHLPPFCSFRAHLFGVTNANLQFQFVVSKQSRSGKMNHRCCCHGHWLGFPLLSSVHCWGNELSDTLVALPYVRRELYRWQLAEKLEHFAIIFHIKHANQLSLPKRTPIFEWTVVCCACLQHNFTFSRFLFCNFFKAEIPKNRPWNLSLFCDFAAQRCEGKSFAQI